MLIIINNKKSDKMSKDKNSIENTNNTQESVKTKPSTKKEVVVELTKKAVKKSGTTTFNFLKDQLIGYIMTSIFSVLLVLFAQHAFKESFDDYYYKTFTPIESEIAIILDDINTATELSLEEIKILFDENDTVSRADTLYRKAIAYSSEDAEIGRLHNVCISVCEDLSDLTSKIYATASLEASPASSMANASLFSDAAKLTDKLAEAEKLTDPAILAEANSLVTKMAAFEDLRDQICEENDIEARNYSK